MELVRTLPVLKPVGVQFQKDTLGQEELHQNLRHLEDAGVPDTAVKVAETKKGRAIRVTLLNGIDAHGLQKDNSWKLGVILELVRSKDPDENYGIGLAAVYRIPFEYIQALCLHHNGTRKWIAQLKRSNAYVVRAKKDGTLNFFHIDANFPDGKVNAFLEEDEERSRTDYAERPQLFTAFGFAFQNMQTRLPEQWQQFSRNGQAKSSSEIH
ncbi:MAG: hypothetical protein HYS87_00855 [Candidatus Colwellbacteria bacterium]|nr:hypothetical protein [Candidatus Colwellbacteria bacterium]